MKTQRVSIALLFVIGTLSCTSGKPTTLAATPAVVKPQLPKDEQGNDLSMPEIVRSKQVQIDHEIKTVTVGNANGDYVLSCNMKAENCQTPTPGKNYYVFNKTTKWKFSGATGYVTLKWFQDWSVSYPNGENIALVPSDGGQPEEIGMYWLSSWTAPDKQ